MEVKKAAIALQLLNFYTFNCEKSQLLMKDSDKNKGILTRITEKLRGRSNFFSHVSPYCSHAISALCGQLDFPGLQTLIETCEEFESYRGIINEIVESCKQENCKYALEKAKELKEKIKSEYRPKANDKKSSYNF